MNANFLLPENNPQRSQEKSSRPTGSLRDYMNQQVQPQSPVSPAPSNPSAFASPGTDRASQVPQNVQAPMSLNGVGQVPQHGPQNVQGQPLSPAPQWRGPAFMARPMQMVQRISHKMAALRRPGGLAVSPEPLVLYRAPQPSVPGKAQTVPVPTRHQPWRRSRIQRVAHTVRRRRERRLQSGPGKKRLGTVIVSTLAAVLLLALVIGGISSYTYYQSQLPRLQGLASLRVSQSTRIFDRNGNILYTLYDHVYGRSTPVSYDEVPGVMQDAQIAAEDKTFWTNNGVDPTAILRSAFVDTSSQQIQTGASTITQQVVKNLDHQTETSFQRKFSEAALAIGLTQQYPKWKILEMYFNIAPYGTQEQGIEAAVQDFFGLKPQCSAHFKCIPAISFLDRDLAKCKNPKDESSCTINPLLGLARASLLASIPQKPPEFDPLIHDDNSALFTRQDYVLQQMMANGMNINLGLGSQTQDASPITPTVIRQVEAITKNINFVGFQGRKKASYFVDWVVSNLATALGDGDYDTGLSILEDSGFNIRTTLDLNLETYVENAVHRHLDELEYQKLQGITVILSQQNNIHDAAVVVMNAKTGEVLAMDGSAGDKSKAGATSYNMALQPRQPGSSFKPITLAAAYQAGWYPGIVLPDRKTYFPESYPGNLPVTSTAAPIYTPTDYGSGYSNRTTNIAESIATSYNIPAVKTLMYAGISNVYNMARRLGISTIDPKKTSLNDSMALGTYEVPLIQMADAYQTFANYGVRIPPQGILDIWDNYGHNLYHYDTVHPAGARVLSPQISYLITSTLDNEALRAPEFEQDHDLSMWDWTLSDGTHPDVAAKTGTTQDFRDNLTMGYTPDVVVGVWSGNADEEEMTNSIGITGAAPIWHSVIEYVSGHCETSLDNIPCPPLDFSFNDYHFTVPPGIVQAPVNHVNGLAGGGYESYMLDGEQPQLSGLNSSVKPKP